MGIYKLHGVSPKLSGSNYFIADNASVVGNVTLGNGVSIWFSAVLRGDVAPIVVADSVNIQDNCVLHGDHKMPLHVGARVTVGHSVILHGCTIAKDCLIGMHATILSGAQIGKNCIIGAHALVTQNKIIPDNSLVVGAPARVVRQVTSAEMDLIKKSYLHYVEQIAHYKKCVKVD
jgi:carbonic anhydrase/acetyltransferase-like protein (isoleucine patch superfamily)